MLGLVTMCVLYFFADNFARLQSYPSAASALRFLAPTIFVFSVMAIFRGFFQGKKTNVPTAISQIIEQIVNAIASILGAHLLLKAYSDTQNAAAMAGAGATLGSVSGAILSLAFLYFVYSINRDYFKRRELKDTTGCEDSAGEIILRLLLTMLPLILSQTIYQISGLIDNKGFGNALMAQGIIEKESAKLYGIYSNKFKWLYNVPVAISYTFSVTIIPAISAHAKSGEIETIRRKVASAMKLNMVIAIPSAVGLTVFAKQIILMLFKNPDDTLSPKLMMLGASAVVVFAYSTFTNGVLQGIDRLRVPVINAAISLAFHIPFVWILIKVLDFGVYGLVIGNVTYGLMTAVLNRFSLEKELGYRQEIKNTYLIPLLCSVIMGILGYGTYSLLMLILKSNTISTLPALIVSVIVYFASMVLLKGLTEEELYAFPKGYALVRMLKKIGLLKDSSDDE